ncbi:MAG: prephenate dehydrogenase [Anaerolineae bacterium]
MAKKLRIAIVGLGLIGTSAGLALRRYQDKVTVIGHDRDPGIAGMARKLGAVDRTEWNLINAVAGADRVLLALPLAELRDTLQAVAADLKPGCVVVDTADVKSPVLAWARELLPDNVSFVGGHPIIIAEKSGQEGARADLFEHKFFCLVADAAAQAGAVHLATDLVEALGGKPFFMDATEHDGMAAAVEHLPLLMAAVLTTLAGRSPGWSDMRKMAGGQFYNSTLMAADSGQAMAAGLLANRKHLLYWLDAFTAEMGEWRRRLEAGDQERLAEDLEESLFTGRRWLADYIAGTWDRESPLAELPTSGSIFRDMFGFGRWRKPAEKEKRP